MAEPETVAALADVGLVFLLFAVGLQLSVGELLRVGKVAIVGGTVQVVAMVVIGYLIALALGFAPLESLFFGAFISQSSSTVMAKILGERGELETTHGHVALGWATLQDLSTIVLVVLLGALSKGGDLVSDIALALGKAAVFLAILIPLGLYVLPWLFERVALLRSREVFVLTVVAVALGTAYVSELFGLSLALGAFLAGMLISESDISHQVLSELSPVRDVFAGVFFVSIGMLFDPRFVVASVGLVSIAVMLIVPVKGALVAALSRSSGAPVRTAVLAGVMLAQAGEFSFLLARLGVEPGVVGDVMFSLMLASAAVSIVISPSAARAAPSVLRELDQRRRQVRTIWARRRDRDRASAAAARRDLRLRPSRPPGRRGARATRLSRSWSSRPIRASAATCERGACRSSRDWPRTSATWSGSNSSTPGRRRDADRFGRAAPGRPPRPPRASARADHRPRQDSRGPRHARTRGRRRDRGRRDRGGARDGALHARPAGSQRPGDAAIVQGLRRR